MSRERPAGLRRPSSRLVTSRRAIANRRAATVSMRDLDEVVQPRRQRLPLLDVRRLAIHPGLAATEDGGRLVPAAVAPRRSRPGGDRPSSAMRFHPPGFARGEAFALIARCGHHLRPVDDSGDAARRHLHRDLGPGEAARERLVGSVDDRPQGGCAVIPAARDDLGGTPPPCAASGVHAPVARRSACSRWNGSIARRIALSRSFQPTHEPKTFSQRSTPTPFSQAYCSSSRWLRFQRRVWCSMCRCSNQRARRTPGHGAVREPLGP